MTLPVLHRPLLVDVLLFVLVLALAYFVIITSFAHRELFITRQVHKPSFTRVKHPLFGYVYVIDKKDMISRAIIDGYEWEADLNTQMAKYYRPDTDILDIGANMGFSSLGINAKRPISGTVHAFEPQYRLCTLLSYNLKNIPSSKVYNCAVSNKSSLISYTINDDNVGATPIVAKDQSQTVYVPTIRLDDHQDLFTNPISIIKIDVEGHELQVLQGARHIIKKHLPTLEVEIYGSTTKVLKLLSPLGYKQVWNKDADYIFCCENRLKK